MKFLSQSFTPVFVQAGVAFFLFYCSLGQLLAQQQDLQQVFPSDKNSAENFGYAVDVKANRAIIGSLRDTYDLDNQNYMMGSGAAYIYELNSEGEWTEKQKLIASDRTAGDRFSQSVSISGDYAAVSTMYRNNNKGAIYLFERNASGIWEEKQILEAGDGTAEDLFGHQIALEGDWLVANAIYEDEDSDGLNTMNNAGSVYVFHRDIDGTWNQSQKIVASDRGPSRGFGRGVALHEETLVVGAPSAGPQYKGAVYAFERNTDGIYEEKQIIEPANLPSSSNFGWSVAVSEQHIMANIMPYSDPGAVYVFEKNSDGSWIEHSKLQAPIAVNDRFGYSIGVDGNLAVIGAYRDPFDAQGGSYIHEAGSAYLYELDAEANWVLKQKLAAPQRGEYWNYGESVALSGTEVLVGSARVTISAWPSPDYVDRIGSGYFYRLDRIAPSGYEIAPPVAVEDQNVSSYSFSFLDGEIGSSYNVVFRHTASGATESFNGIVQNNPQTAGSFDLADLPDGSLELELYLVDASGNTGDLKSTTLQKSTTPTGYLISNLSNPVILANASAVQFSVSGAELGTTYNYVFTDVLQNEQVGSGEVLQESFVIEGIDLSLLEDGPLELSLSLTDGEGLTGQAVPTNSFKDTQAPSGYSINSEIEFINSANVSDITFNWQGAEVGATWEYHIRHESEAGELTGTGQAEQASASSGQLDLSEFADGEIIISFWQTDAYGHVGDSASKTLIKDTTGPIVNCQEVVLSLDADGKTVIDAGMFDNGSTDESGITAMEINMESTLDCSFIGIHEIELTVWDSYMNSSQCYTTLAIEDEMAPQLKINDMDLVLGENGTVALNAEQLSAGSSDNCGIASYHTSLEIFTCEDLGNNEVTLTVTDGSGNQSAATAQVTVIDTMAPTIIGRDLIVYLNANGEAMITPEDIDAGTTDNCSIATLEVDRQLFSCEDEGEQLVMFMATDLSGNFAEMVVTVTVINEHEDIDEDGIPDNCDPEISTPDSSVEQEDPVSDAMDRVKIPQTFTPNGDGINDTWNMVNLELYPTATVYVYNRYGQVVYSTRAYANDWDGTFKQSEQLLPEGATYYYQIDLDSDGKIDKEGWLFITE